MQLLVADIKILTKFLFADNELHMRYMLDLFKKCTWSICYIRKMFFFQLKIDRMLLLRTAPTCFFAKIFWSFVS